MNFYRDGCQTVIFQFIIPFNLLVVILKGKNFSSTHSLIYSFLYQYGHVDSYFIQCIITFDCHYLFDAQILLMRVPIKPLLCSFALSELFFKHLFISDTERQSRFILYFPYLNSGINHFPKGPRFLLVEDGI